ncbi:hypothetical protein F2Q68_00044427 [Brassica cretica]|nr:hypothetical protein F2Q68_00044427 [Brassica cretica]
MSCGEETRPVPLFVGEEETMCVDPSAMEKRLVLVDLSSSHIVERRYFSRRRKKVVEINDEDIVELYMSKMEGWKKGHPIKVESYVRARSSNGEANVGKVVIARDEAVAGDDVVCGDEVV